MFQRITRFMSFLGLLILISETAGGGQVYYVDGANGDDANSGISGWGDALATVSAAIDSATADDEIWVKAGTYKPTDDGDRTKSFTMKEGVDLYGGFAGTETARAQRDGTNNPTILCGDIGVENDPTDNSYHVVVGATARIDGFTIRNGYASGSGSQANGAGMYSVGVGPVAVHCVFTNNVTISGCGGGVFWDQNSFNTHEIGWYNCTFVDNAARNETEDYLGASGGGMYLRFWTNTVGMISNCLFQANSVTGTTSSVSGLYLYDQGQKVWGAGHAFQIVDSEFSNNRMLGNNLNNDANAVYVYGFVAPVAFTDCRFFGNTNEYSVAARGSGALQVNVHTEGEGLRMTRCIFEKNHAPNGAGAVVYKNNAGTNSVWRDCEFRQNNSMGGAGAIRGGDQVVYTGCLFEKNSTMISAGAVNPGQSTFTNCLFEANFMTGSGYGGAVYLSSPARFLDCRFQDNVSLSRGGGAICWILGTATGVIENCTFTENTAQGYGGALWQRSGHLDLRNSTFVSNSVSGYSRGGGAIYTEAGLTAEATDCLFEGNATTANGDAHGGAWWSAGPVQIRRSVFIANRTTGTGGRGGGLCFENLSDEPAGVIHCLFRENTSGFIGGAIATLAARVVISNVTAVGNTSTTAGYGGALAHDSPDSDAEVLNSIFWNNAPLEIGPTNGVSVRYSNIDGGFDGEGNLDTDPLFVDTTYLHLKSTTGDYRNGYFDGGEWGRSDRHSPLVDAGDPQSDWTREILHPGGRINMGAYGNTEVASQSFIPLGTLFMVR